jgi:predicted XRE-type DNA-binding protein
MAKSTINFKSDDIQRFWSKVAFTANEKRCWQWNGWLNKNSYGGIFIDGKNRIASRIAWELTYGQIPNDLNVLHTCDNPSCCNPSHLFLGTILDNNRDKVNKGRQDRGEKHGRHKLTNSQVVEIRQLYSNGNIGQREIADKMNISVATVSRIVNRKLWKEG